MGVITISLEDRHEKRLREMAASRYGKKKGALSKMIIQALDSCEEKESPESILLKWTKKGLHLGKINSKKFRDEIYDKRIKSL